MLRCLIPRPFRLIADSISFHLTELTGRELATIKGEDGDK